MNLKEDCSIITDIQQNSCSAVVLNISPLSCFKLIGHVLKKASQLNRVFPEHGSTETS